VLAMSSSPSSGPLASHEAVTRKKGTVKRNKGEERGVSPAVVEGRAGEAERDPQL